MFVCGCCVIVEKNDRYASDSPASVICHVLLSLAAPHRCAIDGELPCSDGRNQWLALNSHDKPRQTDPHHMTDSCYDCHCISANTVQSAPDANGTKAYLCIHVHACVRAYMHAHSESLRVLVY